MSALEKYEQTHQHPINRVLHAVGIPLIVVCALAAVSPWRPFGLSRELSFIGFGAGWVLLFVGHFIEGNRPLVLSNSSAVVTAPMWWVRRAIQAIRGR
jgi:uncharacterized membrane protein YGL010W